MLLLYRITALFVDKAYTNLHSTMLLLYRRYPPGKFSTIFYLHSTMLLLYLINKLESMGYKDIYIPLCFYFIAMEIA